MLGSCSYRGNDPARSRPQICYTPAIFGPQNSSMDTRTLGEIIFTARQRLQITQRELAVLCEADQRAISAWERDTRPIGDTAWRKLAAVLRLPFTLRDRLLVETVGSSFAERLCPRRLHYRQPRDRKTAIRLLAFRRRNRGMFDALWAQLKRRGDWLGIRGFLLTAWADGRYEVEAWMRFLYAGMKADWLSPLRCGYRTLPYVDPRNRRSVGDCRMPALVRQHPEQPGVIFPQPTLLVGNEVPRPDGLVGMRAHGDLRWCGYEIERNGLPSAVERQERAQLLQMPILYFTAADVQKPDFPETFWKRVYQTLWPTGGR